MSADPAPLETWTITSRRVGSRRVEATVDGVPVWVESEKAPLADAVEAWVTAFCLPAARGHVRLQVDRPVDPTWRAAANANVATTSAWWGGTPTLELDVRDPRASKPRRRSRVLGRSSRREERSYRSTGRALCFTGGVDSFFSLLQSPHRPSDLLYIVGFDIDVDDTPRSDQAVHLVEAVAADQAVSPLIVRTNLRTHPRFATIPWEQSHGAALAAIGHLLSPTVGTVIIPPSFAAERLIPWGSRPDLDPRWSIPGRIEIAHGDATERRVDRILAIADHPLVQRHLRVCWENVGADLNCGRCERCVRTATALAGAGALDDFVAFPPRADLPALIDALASIPDGLAPAWNDLLALDLATPERGAVQALLERSSAR